MLLELYIYTRVTSYVQFLYKLAAVARGTAVLNALAVDIVVW
jgi:hypothetical protein